MLVYDKLVSVFWAVATAESLTAEDRWDRRWNRSPRPQPQTFGKSVFLIYFS